MYLETSAMYLLELHRTREADLRREMREAVRRGAQLEALAMKDERSDEVAGVSLGDRTRRGRDASADLGRAKDLHPASGAEQDARRLVRPVQSQPEP
jgi:hypothetical protein